MHCAHCGAAAIAGSATCYRCERPIEDGALFSLAAPSAAPQAPRPTPQAPRPAPPAPHPAPRAPRPAPDRAIAVRVAAGAAFALALLGLVDLARGDSAAVVLLVAVHALLGVALLRRWRAAWGASVTVLSLDCLLAFLALLGGGVLAGVLVASVGMVGVLALARHGVRASLRKPKAVRPGADASHATLVAPASSR